jgi:casein kinase II subunit beta
VYPTLLPSKDVEAPMGLVAKDGPGSIDPRTGRRRREEPDTSTPTEGGGENLKTASVALKAERYRPRIYGFQLSETAKLQRWQEAVRDR